MLGLVLIYLLGKNFYELAQVHNKNMWGFAVLGVVSYYLGSIIAGAIIYTIFYREGALNLSSESLVSYISIPFGLLSAWGLHSFLKKRWENVSVIANNSDLLDQDLIE